MGSSGGTTEVRPAVTAAADPEHEGGYPHGGRRYVWSSASPQEVERRRATLTNDHKRFPCSEPVLAQNRRSANTLDLFQPNWPSDRE